MREREQRRKHERERVGGERGGQTEESMSQAIHVQEVERAYNLEHKEVKTKKKWEY